jgi:hypothetical protein
MKTRSRIMNLKSVLFAVVLILISSCTTTTKIAPTLTTTTVSGVGSNSAITGGTITSDGGAAITAQGVCWSTSANPTITNNKVESTIRTTSFASTITGLAANTTYYARAYATNSEGTSYGNEITFTTATQSTIIELTTTATATGATTATAGGNITADGGSLITVRGVCWSTASNPTITLSTKTTVGTGIGSFTGSITGLTASTTYYVRAYATNALGTVYGNEVSFTTPAASANTAGMLMVSASTSTAGGGYSPKNIIAVWIKSSTGAFVKSLLVYANTRRYDLTNWVSNSGQNTTDAVTGATQSSYAMRSCSWNGTNASGTVVANGDYKVCMELCDGNIQYHEFTFTKGTSAVTLTPANVTSFSNISIKWTPN